MTLRERVATDGFAILPGVVASHTIEGLISELDEAHRSRAGVRHALANLEVSRCARSAELLTIAGAILGREALPFRATVFHKSHRANWLVVWHQDTALPLRARVDVRGWGPWSTKAGIAYAHAPASAVEKVIALRVHLDDSTTENGPLRVLPGTHRLGVLSDERIDELAGTVAARTCAVKRGGIVAMRPLVLHASSKSRSQAPRRVLHIEYSAQALFEGGLELAIARRLRQLAGPNSKLET